ncbi:MAG: hypothetical protein AABY15_04830 [Nanoarchaeota archaeon]
MKQELQQTHNYDYLKGILANPSLIKWVKVWGVDGLSDHKIPEEIKLELQETSLKLTDSENVKMLVTNARFEGKAIASFSLEQLKEIIQVMGDNGSLKVLKADFPAVVVAEGENGESNCVILAPRVNED